MRRPREDKGIGGIGQLTEGWTRPLGGDKCDLCAVLTVDCVWRARLLERIACDCYQHWPESPSSWYTANTRA